jgi:hypothetical protein
MLLIAAAASSQQLMRDAIVGVVYDAAWELYHALLKA